MAGGPGPPLKPPLRASEDHEHGRGAPSWMDAEGAFGRMQILSLCPTEGSVLPRNHPIVVGKTLQDLTGKRITARTEARGTKYIIETRNKNIADKLLTLKRLTDGTPITVTLHPRLNRTDVSIYCPDIVGLTDEELRAELEPQNVTSIRRIYRTNSDGSKFTTPLIFLTCNTTLAPNHLYVGVLRIPTRIAYPRPMLCYKCMAYGHTKARCPNPARCQNCSGEHETNSDCQHNSHCRNCQGSHKPTDKKCPMYIAEEAALRLKTDRGISVAEARRLIASESTPTSFAKAVHPLTPNTKALESVHNRLVMAQVPSLVEKQLADSRGENQQLRKKVQQLSAQVATLMSAMKKQNNTTMKSTTEIDDAESDTSTASGLTATSAKQPGSSSTQKQKQVKKKKRQLSSPVEKMDVKKAATESRKDIPETPIRVEQQLLSERDSDMDIVFTESRDLPHYNKGTIPKQKRSSKEPSTPFRNSRVTPPSEKVVSQGSSSEETFASPREIISPQGLVQQHSSSRKKGSL